MDDPFSQNRINFVSLIKTYRNFEKQIFVLTNFL